MRFVLVETGTRIWRATAAKPTSVVDVFFHAEDIDEARELIRRKFPEAVFSDEPAGRLQ